MEKKMPSPNQLKALRKYAAANGRYWKAKLNDDWTRACARIDGEISPELQQLRNALGPAWLIRFRFPKDSSESVAVGPERPGMKFETDDVVITTTLRDVMPEPAPEPGKFRRALAKAKAEGHELESDPPMASISLVDPVNRYTCAKCGGSVLGGFRVAYGSATEGPCTGVMR